MILDRLLPPPMIATDRFALRPLRRSDAGLLSLYAGDLRVAAGTRTIPHPLPPGAVEAFIARSQSERRDIDSWAIDGSSHGHAELLGVLSLTRIDKGQSEISYWVAPAFWNTGVASEAVKALVAANPRQDRSMCGVVFQDNAASARVLTNAGFEYIGDAESFSVARNATVRTWTYVRRFDATA